jgi:hypothetical protein
MNQTLVPFDLHTQGAGAFVSFEIGEVIALPLLSLNKATLRGDDGTELVLSFTDMQIVIEGAGLAPLFEHVLSGRVKTIRSGEFESCIVDRVVTHDV